MEHEFKKYRTKKDMSISKELNPKKFLPFIILIILFRLGWEYYTNPTVHRGPWYSLKVPEGWEKKIEDRDEGHEVILVSPIADPLSGIPEAVFSVYGYKSEGALFADDLMVEVLQVLQRENGKILDRGEIKISGQIAKWVLFQYYEPEMMALTFYIVDDFNRLTKIQYTSLTKKFKHYRPVFERFKEEFSFKKVF